MATKDISVCSFLTTAGVSSQSFGLGGLRVQYPSPFNLSSDIPREKVTDHCKVDGKQRHDHSDGVSFITPWWGRISCALLLQQQHQQQQLYRCYSVSTGGLVWT